MEKIYAGQGRIVNTKFGQMTKLSFSLSDLEKLTNEAKLNNGWVNLDLKEKKDKAEGKPTHYCEVSNWKPEPKTAPIEAHTPKQTYQATVSNEGDTLPF
jgi:hypothetical protein